MKISEIMTREVRSLDPQTSVAEAIKKLLEDRISGLPVVDAKGRLVGMFTEKDVLKAILPSYVSNVGRFVYENNPKTIQSKVAKLGEFKVEQFMRKEVVTVQSQTPVCEAAHIMLTQNVRRIPVVDTDGQVVGIVARADVLQNLLQK
jgi:CBS domain-containing protein